MIPASGPSARAGFDCAGHAVEHRLVDGPVSRAPRQPRHVAGALEVLPRGPQEQAPPVGLHVGCLLAGVVAFLFPVAVVASHRDPIGIAVHVALELPHRLRVEDEVEGVSRLREVADPGEGHGRVHAVAHPAGGPVARREAGQDHPSIHPQPLRPRAVRLAHLRHSEHRLALAPELPLGLAAEADGGRHRPAPALPLGASLRRAGAAPDLLPATRSIRSSCAPASSILRVGDQHAAPAVRRRRSAVTSRFTSSPRQLSAGTVRSSGLQRDVHHGATAAASLHPVLPRLPARANRFAAGDAHHLVGRIPELPGDAVAAHVERQGWPPPVRLDRAGATASPSHWPPARTARRRRPRALRPDAQDPALVHVFGLQARALDPGHAVARLEAQAQTLEQVAALDPVLALVRSARRRKRYGWSRNVITRPSRVSKTWKPWPLPVGNVKKLVRGENAGMGSTDARAAGRADGSGAAPREQLAPAAMERARTSVGGFTRPASILRGRAAMSHGTRGRRWIADG